jgi:hypothetical protein
MADTESGAFKSKWPRFKLNIAVPFAILLSLLTLISPGRAKRVWYPVCAGIFIGFFVLQASCGGGGGSVDDTGNSPDTVAPDPSVPLITKVATDINDTEYQITDLQPKTQYYWKIIAVDNWGKLYESLPQRFITLGI